MGEKVPKEVDLGNVFKTEAKDPSMIAYLKSLGIDPDYVPPKDDPRRVVINELHIVFKENPEKNIVLKMATEEDIKNAKKHPLVIKEGVLYKFRVSFRVQHNVVLGLQIKNSVSKLGKTLDTSVEMLGTYPPKNDFQAVDIPKNDWNEAPSGMLARGEYSAHMKFIDDDNKTHLDFAYTVKIAKDFKGDD